jgi:hypothetical protein
MSKRDRLHQALRRTLEKDGWTVTADPLILVLEQAVLRADLGAEKTFAAEKAGRKIAIEVKDFTAASGISELEKNDGAASALPVGVGGARAGSVVVFGD